jgi:hypothetical protein
MVQSITDVIKEYQAKVCQLPFLPRASFHRDSMGYCGDVKFFLTFLFCDHPTGVNFLKDVGIIRSEVQCNLCGRNMTWCADPSVSETGTSAFTSSPPFSLTTYPSSITLIRDLVRRRRHLCRPTIL